MSFNNCIIWNNIGSAHLWEGKERRGKDKVEEERTCSELMDVPWTCNVIILLKRSRRVWRKEKKRMKWMEEQGSRWIEGRVRGIYWKSEKGREERKADGARKRLQWFHLFSGPSSQTTLTSRKEFGRLIKISYPSHQTLADGMWGPFSPALSVHEAI